MYCKDKWKTALQSSWNHPALLSSVSSLFFCLPGLLPNHIFPLHLDTLPPPHNQIPPAAGMNPSLLR